jgi:hypothetical protein
MALTGQKYVGAIVIGIVSIAFVNPSTAAG